ncbi:MAG: hypothetical protein GQ557_00295 [Mycoplasmataceae bacterium]|nr:hypothetical protein [Mycoplasmataceae bacterium]
MTKKILIIAANGVEDIEMIATNDLLKRANIDVDIATKTDILVTSYGINIVSQLSFIVALKNLTQYDGLFIPGGSHISLLEEDEAVEVIINHFNSKNKVIGAICAGPTLLATKGILEGKEAICYPGKKERAILLKNKAIIPNPNCKPNNKCEVVVSGKIVTGLMMDSTFAFVRKFIQIIEKY